MPSKVNSKKAKEKKRSIEETVAQYEASILRDRIYESNDLFTIDTAGKLSYKKAKRVELLKAGGEISVERAEKLKQWGKARQQQLKQEEETRSRENDAFDIWGNTDLFDARSSPQKSSSAFPHIPAVVTAAPGQSTNPSQNEWKQVFLEAVARVNKDRNDEEIFHESMFPVAAELMTIFPDEEISKLSTVGQFKLFCLVKSSKDLIEDPQDFLDRVLPTLDLDTTAEVKQSEEVPDYKMKFEQSMAPPTNSKYYVGKTSQDKKKLERRKLNVRMVKAAEDSKNFKKSFLELSSIKRDIYVEEEQQKLKIERNQSLKDAKRHLQSQGENDGFKVGQDTFTEPPKDVNTWEAVKAQRGSLRRIMIPTKNISLRDRMTSLLRRGMIEQPSRPSIEKFDKIHRNLERIKRWKLHTMSVYDGQSYANTPEPTLRKISSVVVSERYLEEDPRKEIVKYIEVPIIEERVKQLIRHEVIEVEKRVPKYEYQYVDKTVEIPQIQYQDRIVEVPQIREEIKYIPKHEYVERPIEMIEHVPKIEIRVVEKVVEVPGKIIEVPKPYRVEKDVPVPNYAYSKRNILVAQVMRPEFVLSDEAVPIEVTEYVPDYIEVEIPVPKLVDVPIRAKGIVDQYYYPVDVPPPQYNSIIKHLNPLVKPTDHHALPFIYQGGRVPEVAPEHAHRFLEFPDDIEVSRDRSYMNNYGHLRYAQGLPMHGFPSYEEHSSQVLNNATPLLFSASRPMALDREAKSSNRRKHRRRKH